MNILVCVKRVPAPGARINISPDGKSVDTAFLGFTVSPHEECAVEAAVQLVENNGGEVTVLTLGPTAAEEQLRTAVSVGAANAVLLVNDGPDWDPQRTARGIISSIRQLESANGVFDLILFGNESADSCGYQVGIRIAVALGRPMVNGAKSLDVENGLATIRREADAGQELYTLPLPACVGIREGINLPRYPTMKGRLASKKVTIARSEVSAEAGGQRMILLRRPAEKASTTVILGTGPEAASAVVDLLGELGVLR
ncbi:MAG: electron transfer flavoprotein subunit beta/FixA family protein, partial [Ilumatobacteraceae bacterium]